MTHTPNYQLSQWSRDDRILMDDFNADNAKIDAAIAAVAARKAEQSDLAALTALVGTPLKMAAGHYTGDGAASRFISVGFTPRAVLVVIRSGRNYVEGSVSHYYHGGLAVPDSPVGGSGSPIVEIVEGGFRVFYKTESSTIKASNEKNSTFNYIAFG